jgi:hypothetical protein
MLYVEECDYVDIFFERDYGSDGATTSTVYVYSCVYPVDADGDTPEEGSTTFTAADGCFIVENVLLDGDPSTNTEAIYGLGAVWIYTDIQTYGASDAPRTLVRCIPK